MSPLKYGKSLEARYSIGARAPEIPVNSVGVVTFELGVEIFIGLKFNERQKLHAPDM